MQKVIVWGNTMLRTVKAMPMLTIVVLLSIVLISSHKNRKVVEAFVAYGSTDKPDALLVSDFATCLKQQNLLFPLKSVECVISLHYKYGATATYRIDLITKSLIN